MKKIVILGLSVALLGLVGSAHAEKNKNKQDKHKEKANKTCNYKLLSTDKESHCFNSEKGMKSAMKNHPDWKRDSSAAPAKSAKTEQDSAHSS